MKTQKKELKNFVAFLNERNKSIRMVHAFKAMLEELGIVYIQG